MSEGPLEVFEGPLEVLEGVRGCPGLPWRWGGVGGGVGRWCLRKSVWAALLPRVGRVRNAILGGMTYLIPLLYILHPRLRF